MAAGLPGMPRGDRLALGPAYVAAALWRRHGYGRGCALPFWAAPVSRIDALARQGEGISSWAISTASPRRQCAGRANSIGCMRRHAGSRIARERPLAAASGRRGRPARAAHHRTSARPPARCFDPRRAGPRGKAGRGGRAARDDRTHSLAGIRDRLRRAFVFTGEGAFLARDPHPQDRAAGLVGEGRLICRLCLARPRTGREGRAGFAAS